MSSLADKDVQDNESALVRGFSGPVTDELTTHCYDGIQEYDNPLPGWWKWLFIGTVLFAFPYIVYYHGAEAPTQEERYSAEVAETAKLAFAEIGELNGDEATMAQYLNEPTWVAYGESVYKANCVSCHGATGGGLVGPNLTDEEYLHINNLEDIYKVINEGANRGAMPAWLNRLEQNDRVLVSVYVAKLRGSNPGGNAKGPQGKVIPAWPTAAKPNATN